MKVSYRWLRDLSPGLEDGPDELAERLALAGAPVEDAATLDEGLEGIVVARVDDVREHPDADRLVLCDVYDGQETVQVVCGAPNVRPGRLYPFARVGATLPGGMEIRKAKIRGQESRGMLCSARELGLGKDDEGILELPEDVPAGVGPGRPLSEALELDDVRLDVEVTANRGDLLSHVGIAREVAPGGVAGVRLPEIPGSGGPPAPERVDGTEEVEGAGARIRIEAPELCPRYLGAVVRGVRVGASPAWLSSRLRAAGARPVNNVVDATNYVLLELGQPLHAFDLGTLEGGEIVVRRAREGERIRTLDGEERTLDPEMLAICDASRPVAVAGVLGGEESEVTGETTDVLLECALFEPTSVRSTRKALDVSTDASYRFERGVDPDGMERALLRAVEIVVAAAGGTPDGPILDVHPAPAGPVRIDLRPERVERILGVPFTRRALADLLEPLGFAVEDPGEGALRVGVPGWRLRDVTREVDLVEEVARRHGYDRFPSDPRPFPPTAVPEHPLFELEDRLRSALVARGCQEAQNSPLTRPEAGEVALRNPVSARESHLRSSLIPPLLGNVEHNLARGVRDVRLFELGTVFLPSDGSPPPDRSPPPKRGESRSEEGRPVEEGRAVEKGRPVEEARVAVVLAGRRRPPHWSAPDEPVDVWDVKGLLAELAEEVAGDTAGGEAGTGSASGVTGVRPPGGGEVGPGAPDHPLLVPAESFTVRAGDGTPIGHGGRVRPERVDVPAWAEAVWALELSLPAEPDPPAVPTAAEVPAYPGSDRDLALIVPDRLPADRVRRALVEGGEEHLAGVEVFDLYRGGGIPEGTRSVAFRLHFRSPDRTLTDREVEDATGRLVDRLREELDVEPRGA